MTSTSEQLQFQQQQQQQQLTSIEQVKEFSEVQELLEQNRVLLNEIDNNQKAQSPAGLRRNVPLIRQVNDNLKKVVLLYEDVSKRVFMLAEQST